MDWRRLVGASIMVCGAGIVSSVAALATLLAAGDVEAGRDGFVILGRLLGGWYWPLLGAATMMAGRFVYGHWREAAPVARVTGAVAGTVGLVVAAALGAMLVFLILSGLEHEDTPAAAALGVGVILGLLLAHFGVGLRNTQQRYPTAYSPASDPPE